METELITSFETILMFRTRNLRVILERRLGDVHNPLFILTAVEIDSHAIIYYAMFSKYLEARNSFLQYINAVVIDG